jgi:hypothetical protein
MWKNISDLPYPIASDGELWRERNSVNGKSLPPST